MVVCVEGFVFCVIRKMCREYAAVSRVAVPVRIIVVVVQFSVEVMIMISPIKLMDGGSAMFIRLVNSHHVVISGIISCSPRVRSMVRVCVRS